MAVNGLCSVHLTLKILFASSAVEHEDHYSLSVISMVQLVIVGLTLSSLHRFIDPLENRSYQRT